MRWTTLIFALWFSIANASPAEAPSASFINGREHDTESLTCDLPAKEHLKNIGSAVDGQGLCVMSSIEMAARWQGLEQMRGLRDWCAKQPGGAYPAKVDQQLRVFCAARHIAVPPYLQYEGGDPRPILDLCNRTGRMTCMTYGYSPRYRGPVAHMTCCAKFGSRWAVCLDNNFPGDQSYEWMTLEELVRRVKYSSGSAWLFVWLAPPPPPVPHN
jgi:hypothetical protein